MMKVEDLEEVLKQEVQGDEDPRRKNPSLLFKKCFFVMLILIAIMSVSYVGFNNKDKIASFVSAQLDKAELSTEGDYYNVMLLYDNRVVTFNVPLVVSLKNNEQLPIFPIGGTLSTRFDEMSIQTSMGNAEGVTSSSNSNRYETNFINLQNKQIYASIYRPDEELISFIENQTKSSINDRSLEYPTEEDLARWKYEVIDFGNSSDFIRQEQEILLTMNQANYMVMALANTLFSDVSFSGTDERLIVRDNSTGMVIKIKYKNQNTTSMTVYQRLYKSN